MVFYFQKILDEGTTNPVVARIHVQLSELLGVCRIGEAEKNDLQSIFFDVMKAILAANKEAMPLIEELQSIECDLKGHGLNLEPHKTAIPASLKLDNVKIFLKHANECLKLLAQALGIFFEKGWKDAKFDSILECVKGEQDKTGERWQLVELLQHNATWLSEIVELRNIDEHKFHKRQKAKAFLKNYAFVRNGAILTLARPKLHNGKDVLAFLIDAIQRLFLLSEELIVSAITLYLPEPVTIEEIPVERRIGACPKRFKYALGYFGFPPRNHSSVK